MNEHTSKMAALNTPAGVVEVLHCVAAIDGAVNEHERLRIAEIEEALGKFDVDAVLAPVTVLSLLFDVAIADGRIHDSEESFLAEIAAASDALGVTLSSFREAWEKCASYQERVRRVGLLARGDVLESVNGSYAIGHAVVDICSALRRQNATDIKVHLLEEARSVLVSASAAVLGARDESLLRVLGLQDQPATNRGVLTRSTAALELHMGAAGGLVAGTTTILALRRGEAVVATAFGRMEPRRMASASSVEWARDVIAAERHDVGVLLGAVGASDQQGWKRRAFDEIMRRVDERLHRWGAADCPGGTCNLRVMNLRVSQDGAADPFRKDALPNRTMKRFVEPRPGLILDVRVHELQPVPIALAYRVSANEDMVELAAPSSEGLLRGLPAPGIYLYDDIGRCVLIEHLPHDVERFVATDRVPATNSWLGRHRIRIDVLERPKGMQSVDCLNFSALWSALLR